MILQPRLNPLRQCLEIRDALQFVIRQLDFEMLLQACEKAERLQAVDAELLKEVIVGRKLRARDLKLRGGQVEDLINGLLFGSHNFPRADTAGRRGSRRISLVLPEQQGERKDHKQFRSPGAVRRMEQA